MEVGSSSLPGTTSEIIVNYGFSVISYPSGGLAQLARAPALQAGGQRFESVILHISGMGIGTGRESCNHNSQFPILNSQFGIVL